MSRLILSLGILLVVVVGATILFAGRAAQGPQATVEQPVDLANLT